MPTYINPEAIPNNAITLAKLKDVSIPVVNNATLTIRKNGTNIQTFTANSSIDTMADISVNELPAVTANDNGKILMVVNGVWTMMTPVSIYSGSSAPDNTQGVNGDIYLQT
jgi:hypothetical protein